MKNIISLAVTIIVLPLAISSCSRCGESPESIKKTAFEQKGTVEKISKDFDPANFGTDPQIRELMLSMPFSEATRRLGDVSFSQSYRIQWMAPGKEIALKGSDDITQTAGGDFKIISANDSGYGIDAIFKDGKLYVGDRGKYHEQPNDEGQASAVKESAWGALQSFWDLFKGKLHISKAGTTDFNGRLVTRYDISLEKPGYSPTKSGKAKNQEKDGEGLKLDNTTPVSAKGFVLVDEQAKTIVKTDLQGDLESGSDNTTMAKITFSNELKPLKPGTKIEKPATDIEPARQKTEKDPLGKFEGRKIEGKKESKGLNGTDDSEEDSENSAR